MNTNKRHIITEDFNFNNIRNDSTLSDVVLNDTYQRIFKKIAQLRVKTRVVLVGDGIESLTDSELELFRDNLKNGYKFKYKVKDYDELYQLVHNNPLEDLNWLDVTNVTDMHELFRTMHFYGDISKWDMSHVKRMHKMFMDCQSLKCDINEWDVSNVEDMSSLFLNARISPDISKWNTKNVLDMSHMFQGSEFKGDISKWNVSNVETMSSMFDASIFTGDISDWDVHNVENMWGMFLNSNFNGLLFNWNTVSVKNMGYMFAHCNFNKPLFGWDVSNVDNMSYMFYNNPRFNQDLSMWNANPTYCTATFAECPITEDHKPETFRKEYLDAMKDKMTFESFDFNSIKTKDDDLIYKIYYDRLWQKIVKKHKSFDDLTKEEKELFVQNRNNGYPYKYRVETKKELKELIQHPQICIRMENMIVTWDLNWIDVSAIRNMLELFFDVDNPENMDNYAVDQWDVSHVRNMKGMFLECYNFNWDISGWDVSNCETFEAMFQDCHSFNYDLSNWDVSSADNLSFMFHGCSKFNLNLSKWNVSNCKTMAFMFAYCSDFNLDLSIWDISNCNNFLNMFQWCSPLRHLQKWNLSNIPWSYKCFMYQGCVCERENEKYE